MSVNIEVKPGTELHATLVKEIKARESFSFQEISKRVPAWEKADKRYRMYEKKKAATTAEQQTNPKEEDLAQIYISYDYALLLTAYTYVCSVFLSRDPVFQFMGRHGEDEMQVQAVETIMAYQMDAGRNKHPLYTWILDACRYGSGIVWVDWESRKRLITRFEDVPETVDGIAVEGKFKTQRTQERKTIYEGNRIFNVRPYDFRPDPRVPMSRVQDGEFCGFFSEISKADLINGSRDGTYINVEEVLKKQFSTTSEGDNMWSQYTDPDGREPAKFDSISQAKMGNDAFRNLLTMVIEIVPKEWGVDESTTPEKWIFTLCNNTTIIQARPLALDHCMFPCSVMEWEPDGYAFSARGLLEILDPLTRLLSWMFNTHVFNVRKAINNIIFADPSRIVMKDLEKAGGGGIVRLKPEAYGSSVTNSVHQLQVQDVTRQHMQEASTVMSLMQITGGVNENLMGEVPTKRMTGTEARTSSSAAVIRLRTMCEYNSAQAWQPLSEMLLLNSQQYYTKAQKLRIAGDSLQQEYQERFMEVTPELIAGTFDFIPVDGTMPIDRFAQANLYKEFLVGIQQMPPQVAQGFDTAKLFAFALRMAGIKNVDQFKVTVLQPGQVPPPGATEVDPAGMGGDPNAGTRTAEGVIPKQDNAAGGLA